MSEPVLIERQCGGWLATGDGWAVTGGTREDAIEQFRAAEERHRRIDARPYLYERLQADAASARRPRALSAPTGEGDDDG